MGLTATALVALSFGLPAFIMIKILVVPFFANEDTKTPIKISLACMLINLILNLILIRDFYHVGLAISTSASAWINTFLLFYILKKRNNFCFDKSIIKVCLKVFTSSIIMSIITIQIHKLFLINLSEYSFFNTNFALVVCIIFGIIIYIATLYILGIKEFEIDKWKNQKKKLN